MKMVKMPAVKQLVYLNFALLILSGALYWWDQTAFFTEPQSQILLQQLDIDKIDKIEIFEKGAVKVTLQKDQYSSDKSFNVKERKDYPAQNTQVNDLFFSLTGMEASDFIPVDKKNQDQLAQWELSPEQPLRKIVLHQGDKVLETIYIGKDAFNPTHQVHAPYVRMGSDSKVAHLNAPLRLSLDADSYVDTFLVALKEDQIKRAHFKKPARKWESAYSELVTEEQKNAIKGKEKELHEKFKKLFGTFANVRFKDVFRPQDDLVKNLNFQDALIVNFKDYVEVTLSVVAVGERYFAKLSAKQEALPDEIQMERNASKEQMKDVDAMLKAKGKADKMNAVMSKYIYELSDVQGKEFISF